MGTYNDNAVELKKIAFSYSAGESRNGLPLYEDFSLSVRQNSIVTVMGASGLGKSTLGKLIAGLAQPVKGNIAWSSAFKNKSDVVYVDQQPMNSVFPWQNVERNIEYPLKKLRWNKDDIRKRKKHLLEVFHLDSLANSFPAQLSGGELQRLALARCLSWRPQLLVLDESFSALDRKTKEDIFRSVHKLALEDQLTVIIITHNLSDALALSTRCIVLDGRPVKLVADIEICAAYPRTESAKDYQCAKERLAGVFFHVAP